MLVFKNTFPKKKKKNKPKAITCTMYSKKCQIYSIKKNKMVRFMEIKPFDFFFSIIDFKW